MELRHEPKKRGEGQLEGVQIEKKTPFYMKKT
jgi:hypothetical protein